MNKFSTVLLCILVLGFAQHAYADNSTIEHLPILVATDNAMSGLPTNATFRETFRSQKGFMIIQFSPNEVAIFEKGKLHSYVSTNTKENSHKDRVTISNDAARRIESTWKYSKDSNKSYTSGLNFFSRILDYNMDRITNLDGNPISISYDRKANKWRINYDLQ